MYQNLVSSSIEKKNFKGKIPNSMGKLQKLERLNGYRQLVLWRNSGYLLQSYVAI